MGPSEWQKRPTFFLRVTLLGAGLVSVLLAGSCFLSAQPSPPAPGYGSQEAAPLGTISGTVLDVTGTPLVGAQVRLTRETATPVELAFTAANGQFCFANVRPGPFTLSIALAGFKTKTISATLPDQQDYLSPAIALEVAPVVTEVSVRLTTVEVAQEQIKEQEQQKLLAVIPNYYASYVPNAAPLNPKQKFELAWKLVIDPSSFVIAGIIAGGQQANNSFPGYGQGAAGYFNRFGAAYGDFFIGTYISNAILPSILKQDPRYFYKGTGSTKSRIFWALKRSVMAKGDNGHWQPDYSGILGSLAAGGISNLYYPEGSRHGFETTVTNTLIGIGTGAGVNLLQEFVFPKVTPKLPKKDPQKS